MSLVRSLVSSSPYLMLFPCFHRSSVISQILLLKIANQLWLECLVPNRCLFMTLFHDVCKNPHIMVILLRNHCSWAIVLISASSTSVHCGSHCSLDAVKSSLIAIAICSGPVSSLKGFILLGSFAMCNMGTCLIPLASRTLCAFPFSYVELILRDRYWLYALTTFSFLSRAQFWCPFDDFPIYFQQQRQCVSRLPELSGQASY